jgi:hypothetical protein
MVDKMRVPVECMFQRDSHVVVDGRLWQRGFCERRLDGRWRSTVGTPAAQ